MTADMMNLRRLVETPPDADLLRLRSALLLSGLWSWRWGRPPAPTMARCPPCGSPSVTATATATGKRAPGLSKTCAFPSSGRVLIPGFLELCRMAEKALTAVIQEAYIQGIFDPLGRRPGEGHGSQRHLQKPGLAFPGDRRQKAKAFLEWRLIEGDWPYLCIHATYLKVRRGGRIVSVALIIAVGVNGDGRREVLGHADRHVGGRADLDGVVVSHTTRPARRQAGRLRRA